MSSTYPLCAVPWFPVSIVMEWGGGGEERTLGPWWSSCLLTSLCPHVCLLSVSHCFSHTVQRHTDTLNPSLSLHHCVSMLSLVLQTDYYYEYTECDSTGSRWRVAIPQSHGSCIGLPEPVRGTECSKYCVCVCQRCFSHPLISCLEFLPVFHNDLIGSLSLLQS